MSLINRFIVTSAIIVCALLCVSCSSKSIEIHTLKYGESKFVSSEVFYDGDKTKIPFEWMFWVVKVGSDITLIDCGINNQDFVKKWNINKYKSPKELLKEINIKPENISRVIITHGHADHIDGCSLFPNAEIYIQQKEYDAIRNGEPGYYIEHLEYLNKLIQNGKLKIIDGDQKITKVISVELAPYHTRGTQSVIVKSDNQYIFVPDNAYVNKNINDYPASAENGVLS